MDKNDTVWDFHIPQVVRKMEIESKLLIRNISKEDPCAGSSFVMNSSLKKVLFLFLMETVSGLDWASNLQTPEVRWAELHQNCEEDSILKTL